MLCCLGVACQGSPALRLDDLLVALGHAYQVSDQYRGDPGCTIDPLRDAEDPWRIKRVEVFEMPGGMEAPPMASRHVAIDYP